MFVLRGDSRAITLEIESATGEVFSYTIARVPPGLSDWCVSLTHTESGESYRVGLVGDRFSCNCPSFRYRKGPHAPAGCKHTTAVRNLYLFLRRLEAEPCH